MTTESTCSLYFYQATRLIAIKQGNQHRTIFRTVDMPLAQQQSDSHKPGLLAIDGKGTVLQVQQNGQGETHRYSAYGHDPRLPSLLTLLGFNGEASTSLQSDYALGNGHRSFSPARMRFNSPDSLSPFGRGGLNAYCYCMGDPVNNIDPSGRSLVFLPNGQIMRRSRNMATPAGHWMSPSTLTRTASLKTLNLSPPSNQTRRASFSGASPMSEQAATPSTPTKKIPLQRVSPYRPDTPQHLVEWVIRDARHEPLLPRSTAGGKPTATIKAMPSTQESSWQLRSDPPEPSSSDTSRDSTPRSSRSASPTQTPNQPY